MIYFIIKNFLAVCSLTSGLVGLVGISSKLKKWTYRLWETPKAWAFMDLPFLVYLQNITGFHRFKIVVILSFQVIWSTLVLSVSIFMSAPVTIP